MPSLRSDFVYRGTPIIVRAANGARLHTDDGKTLVDLEASSGAAILGYDSTLVDEAVERIRHIPSKPQFCESTTRLELVARLDALFLAATGRPGRVALDLGGAQGIELALKLVSATKPEASTIVTFEGCYHGRSLTTAALSVSRRYEILAGRSAFHVVRLPVPSLMAHSRNIPHDEARAICFQGARELFRDERFGLANEQRRLHSLLFEPILNVAGMFPLDADYLGYVTSEIRRLGGTVIADEIFTGFYKGKGFLAAPAFGVTPDVVVISKGLTNGLLPLTVVWVSEETNEAADRPGLHSATYINSELTMAVALSVLDRIEAGTCRMDTPGRALRHIFAPWVDHPSVREAFFLDNVCAIRMRSPDLAWCLAEEMRRQGVLVAFTGLAKDSLIAHPCLTLSDEEVESAAVGVGHSFTKAIAPREAS